MLPPLVAMLALSMRMAPPISLASALASKLTASAPAVDWIDAPLFMAMPLAESTVRRASRPSDFRTCTPSWNTTSELPSESAVRRLTSVARPSVAPMADALTCVPLPRSA